MLKEKSQIIAYLNLKKVKELRFNYSDPSDDIKATWDRAKLAVKCGLEFRHDAIKNYFIILIDFRYEYKISDKKKLLIVESKTETSFHILNLNKVMEAKKGSKYFNIHKKIMEDMIKIVVSNLRGMLIIKTAGTYMNEYYVPINLAEHLLKTLNSK